MSPIRQEDDALLDEPGSQPKSQPEVDVMALEHPVIMSRGDNSRRTSSFMVFDTVHKTGAAIADRPAPELPQPPISRIT